MNDFEVAAAEGFEFAAEVEQFLDMVEDCGLLGGAPGGFEGVLGVTRETARESRAGCPGRRRRAWRSRRRNRSAACRAW